MKCFSRDFSSNQIIPDENGWERMIKASRFGSSGIPECVESPGCLAFLELLARMKAIEPDENR